MKKRILMLLCAAVLAISIAAPPALAAGGPFYPISVEEYTYGSFDELRINKVYQLSLSDDPSAPSNQTGPEAPDTDPAPAKTGSTNWLSLLGCAGGVAALAAAALWTIQKMKERRT